MRTEPAQTKAAARIAVAQLQRTGSHSSPLIAALQAHMARLERSTLCLDKTRKKIPPWLSGVPEIDGHLAWSGLAPFGLHDVSPRAYGDMPAAMRFALGLALRRLADAGEWRPLLWCRLDREVREYGRLYGHGLESFGLPRNRFITVTLKKPVALLWTAEEALKSGSVSLVIADADSRHAGLTATRRLALAASAGKCACVLVFATPHAGPTASHTRWTVASCTSRPPPYDPYAPGASAFEAALTRSRRGRLGKWTVEWQHATHRFALVPALRGGAVYPGQEESGQIATA